jgi:hypothetical protein
MASLFTPPFLDVGAGITPADGALLNFHVPGSGTNKDTFTTAAATAGTEHPNPVPADALGVFPAIYIQGDYDWVLDYKTGGQVKTGSVSEFATVANSLFNKNFATLALAKADTNIVAGDAIILKEHTSGNGGGGIWDVIAGTGTANGIDKVAHDTLSLTFVYRLDEIVQLKQIGAQLDDTNDDTTIIQYAWDNYTNILHEPGTARTTATLVMPDNTHVHLLEGSTIKSTTSTAVRLTCTFSSLTGAGWDSVIQSTNSDNKNGIVLLGHPNTTDETIVFYNTLDNFRIVGADGQGRAAASIGKYTVGLMLFNNQSFFLVAAGHPAAVYYNKISNLFVEQVKEGVICTSTVNANFFDTIMIRLVGQTGFGLFSPLSTSITTLTGAADGTTANKLVDSTGGLIRAHVGETVTNTTDATSTTITAIDSDTQLSLATDIFISGEAYSIAVRPGNRYGYDWNLAVRDSGAAENICSNIFVTDSLQEYGSVSKGIAPTVGYDLISFGDGNYYHDEGVTLRTEFTTDRATFTNFMGEPGFGFSYKISAGSLNFYAQGSWNSTASATPIGDASRQTVHDGAGCNIASSNIQALQSYTTKFMLRGSDALPSMHHRDDLTTGLRFPATGSMALISGGAQKARVSADGLVAGSGAALGGYVFESVGSAYINGDTRLKNTYPIGDNAYSIGTASFRWTVVYATTGTINTSDEREKTFLEITESEKACALEIKANLRKFKWNSAIAEKGDDGARIHIGGSSQQVRDIFLSHGLDAHKYGLFCYDEWIDDGGLERNKYGLRYEELLCFIISAM